MDIAADDVSGLDSTRASSSSCVLSRGELGRICGFALDASLVARLKLLADDELSDPERSGVRSVLSIVPDTAILPGHEKRRDMVYQPFETSKIYSYLPYQTNWQIFRRWSHAAPTSNIVMAASGRRLSTADVATSGPNRVIAFERTITSPAQPEPQILHSMLLCSGYGQCRLLGDVATEVPLFKMRAFSLNDSQLSAPRSAFAPFRKNMFISRRTTRQCT